MNKNFREEIMEEVRKTAMQEIIMIALILKQTAGQIAKLERQAKEIENKLRKWKRSRR